MGQAHGDALFDRVYGVLRPRAERLMRRERKNHTLSTMALVNEAYFRVRADKRFKDKSLDQFLGCVVRSMERVLIDHARKKGAKKRGEGRPAAEFREELDCGYIDPFVMIDLDDSLKALALQGGRVARQVQVFKLHLLAGQALETIAMLLGISRSTVHEDWTVIRARIIAEFGRE